MHGPLSLTDIGGDFALGCLLADKTFLGDDC